MVNDNLTITADELAAYLEYEQPDFNDAGRSPRVYRTRAERVERWGPRSTATRNRRRRSHGRPRGR